MELEQRVPPENEPDIYTLLAPKRTSLVPEKEHCCPSEAQNVQPEDGGGGGGGGGGGVEVKRIVRAAPALPFQELAEGALIVAIPPPVTVPCASTVALRTSYHL